MQFKNIFFLLFLLLLPLGIMGQTLSISSNGQTGTSGTNWSTSGSNPVIITATNTTDINTSVIAGYLNSGTSVEIRNTTAGFIQIESPITKSAGGDATLTIRGNSRVSVFVGGPITSTSKKLNVVLWSDYDNNNDGGVSLVGNLVTNGGHVWLGGSSTNGGNLTWNGMTVGDGPSVGAVGANYNALDLYADVTTSGGDFLAWAGDGYSNGIDGVVTDGGEQVNTGTGDIILITDIVGGSGTNDSIDFTTTGTFTLAPNGGSFVTTFRWNPVVSGSDFDFPGNSGDYFNYLRIENVASLGGLTIGQYKGTGLPGDSQFNVTNTSDVTISTATTIAGPISIYSGNISVNQNLTSTGAGADVLLKGFGDITLAASRAITTNGGDVILWANSDGATSNGSVFLRNGSSITTSGGNVWAGGGSGSTTWNGLTVGNGYAVAGTSVTPSNGGSSVTSGIYLENTTITTSRGHVLMKGDGQSSYTGIMTYGSNSISTVEGTINIEGTVSGSINAAGIVFGMHDSAIAGNVTMISSASEDAIKITGIGKGSGGGVELNGTMTLESKGSGNISINGTGGSGYGIEVGSYYYGKLNAYAASGDIKLDGGTGGVVISRAQASGKTGWPSGINLGQGGNVASSSSDVSVIGDVFSVYTGNGYEFNSNSTGTVTIAPHSDSFSSAFSFPITNASFGTSITGLTLGKAGNTANMTISTATSINGPISVFGNAINVNANLESTASGAAILLQSNGAGSSNNNGFIILASSRNITTNGGDIILWPNAANRTSGQANNELVLAGSNTLTSNGGKIVLAGGFDDGGTSSGIPGLTAADGVPDGYVYRGSYTGAAVDIRGGVTLDSDGGEIIIRGEQNGYDSGIELDATFTIADAGKVTIEGKNSASVATAKSVYMGTANITATAANAGVTILGNTHIQNNGLTTVSTQGGDVLIAGNIDDATDGETATNGQLRLTSGVSITTNTGDITLAGGDRTGTGYAQGATTNSIQEGVRIDGATNLQSGGGNIILRGKSPLVQAGSATGASGVGFYFLSGNGEINSGTGTILIDGYSQTSGSTASAGLHFWNNSSNTFTIQSANTTASAITINAFSGANGIGGGESVGIETEANNTLNILARALGGGITINTGHTSTFSLGSLTGTGHPYDIIFRGPTNILANGGPIALKGGQFNGETDGILYIDYNLYLGSKDNSLVTSSSSDVTLQFDRYIFANSAKPQFATTGRVTVQPNDTSFWDNVTTAWFDFNQNSQTMSGLTIGKAGNNTGITQATANLTANGSISFYGSDIAINENILTTDGGAAGDVLMKGLSDITLAEYKSIVTGGADITLWSDANDDGGHIYIPNGVQLDSRTAADRTAGNTSTASGGGTITLGGGSVSTTLASGTAVPTGVAWQTDGGIPGGILMGTYSTGIASQNTGIQLLSGGGDVTLRGKSTEGSDNVRLGVGIMEGTTIDAGTTGGITISGEAVGPATNGLAGVDFPSWRSGNTAPVLRTHDGNISISGTTSGGAGTAVLLAGHSSAPPIIASTGTGSLTVEGTGTGANSNVSISATRLLASSGLIRVKSQAGTVFASPTGLAEPIALGSLTGTPVTSSTSNVEIISNALSLATSNGFAVNTSGKFTLVPAGDDFTSAITYPITDLSLDAAVSGLTIGKASSANGTSDADVTVAGTTTIAGPITVYANDININENLNTSSGGASGDILLKGSGDITLAASKSITTDDGNVILWADSDGNNQGRIELKADITTSGGAVYAGGGSAGESISGLQVQVPTGNAITGNVNEHGVLVSGASIDTSGGNLRIRGQNNSSSSDDTTGSSTGIMVVNSSINTAAGAMSLYGKRTGSPHYSTGIWLGTLTEGLDETQGDVTFSTTSGNLDLEGVSEAATEFVYSHGIVILAGGTNQVSLSTGSGNISITGDASNAALQTGEAVGLVAQMNTNTAGLSITTDGGNIQLEGVSNHTGGDAGIGIRPHGKIGSVRIGDANTGNITVKMSSLQTDPNNTGIAKSITIENVGNVVFEGPTAGNFSTDIDITEDYDFKSSISSFRLGKSANTQNITFGSATSISGPITIYGGDITVNKTLNTTGGGASGDILLKGSGDITLAANKSITTDDGDVILWSNSDGTGGTDGYILLRDSSSIVTSSGNLWMGGGSGTSTWNGLTVGNDYATAGTAISSNVFLGSNRADVASGIYLENTSINTGGGNFAAFGSGDDSGVERGILAIGDLTINTGSGKIYMDAKSNSEISLIFGHHSLYTSSENVTLISSNTEADAITVSTVSSNTGTGWSYGTWVEGTATVQATNGGGIVWTTEGVAKGINLGYSTNSGILNLLSSSGKITLNTKAKGINIQSEGQVNLGRKAGTSVEASSSNINIIADDFASSGSNVFNFDTSGVVTITPQDGNSFTSAFNTSGLSYSSDISGLTIGHSENTQDISIGSATTIAGPITVYGGNLAIGAALTATSSNINLHSSGTVTQTAAITANGLGLNGAGTFTLQNSANNVATIAGGTSGARLANIAYRDADALEIGSVNPDGIFSSGTVLIETENGNLTLSKNIDTTSSSDDAIILNAGRASSAGTALGGDIIISNTPSTPTLTYGTGGRAKLFSGTDENSSGLTALADETRSGFDEVSQPNDLADDNTYAIYRVAIGAGDLTIVASGGDAENSTWRFDSGTRILTTLSTPVNVNASVVEGYLSAGALTIEAANITVDADVTSTTANSLILKATGNITVNEDHSIQTNAGDIIFWANAADGNTSGHILMDDGVTLNSINGSTSSGLSGGGDIILAGGSSVDAEGYPNGYAQSSTKYGVSLNATQSDNKLFSAYSGGGDIRIYGKSTSSSADSWDRIGVVTRGDLLLNSGTGQVDIRGVSEKFYGINISNPTTNNASGPKLEILSAAPSGTAISIAGTSESTTYGVVFNYINPKEILATAGGDITITGVTTGGTYGIFNSNTDILASDGTIAIDGGLGLIVTNNGSGYISDFGYVSGHSIIGTSAANIIVSANIIVINDPLNVSTSGTFTLEPSGDDFPSAITYPIADLSLSSDVSGLTIGKSDTSADGTSDANVTIGSATTIAGPINVYGGGITLNQNVTSTASGADILLKSTAGITVAQNKQIFTNAGDIVMWANADSSGHGAIYINAGVDFDSRTAADRTANTTTDATGGGAIILAGASDTNSDGLPDGYAKSTSGYNAGVQFGPNTWSSHSDVGTVNDVTFYSGGGDVIIRGAGEGASGSNQSVERRNGFKAFPPFVINTGSGAFILDADENNAGTSAIYLYTNGSSVVSDKPSDTAISISANGSSSTWYNSIYYTREWIASGGGDIVINSSSTVAANGDVNLVGSHVLALGDINITASGDIAVNKSSYGSGTYFGAKDGSLVSTTSGNINLKGSVSHPSSGVLTTFRTSGNVTVEPSADDFSYNHDISHFSFEEDPSSFRFGKASSADGTDDVTVTIGRATTIAGPISVYGGTIAVNQNLNTTGGGAAGDILLKASSNITQGNNADITTDGGDVIYWADSDANNNGYISFGPNGGQEIVTNGGDVYMAGGTGTTIPEGYAQGGSSRGVSLPMGSTRGLINTGNGGGTAGDIIIRGKSTGNNDGIYTQNFQLFGHNITLDGETSTGNSTYFAVRLGSSNVYNGSNLSQVIDAENDLTITAVNKAASYAGNALRTGANPRLYADGNFTLNTSGKLDYTSNQTFININPTKTLSVNFDGTATFTTSLGDPTLSTPQGGLVIQSYQQDSFTSDFNSNNWTFNSNLGGLTIGKTTNTAGVTIDSATTIAGPITVYGGEVNIDANLTSTATSGNGITIQGQRIFQDNGIDATTSGSDISYTSSNFVSTSASVGESVIVLQGNAGDRAILNADGGNITVTGSYGAGGVAGGIERAIVFNVADIITSGSGNISLTGDATNSGNTGNTAWGMQPNDAKIITDTGDIVLTMTGGAATINSRGLALDGQSMQLLSTSGTITVRDQKPAGLTGNYNGLYLRPSAVNSIILGADGSTVVSSSSDIIIEADKATFDAIATVVKTSGSVIYRPVGDDFASAVTFPTANLSLGAAVSGLTIGKASSADGTLDMDVTIGGATTIAGPITLYGKDLKINAALTATSADINLYPSGAVTQTAGLTADGLGLHGAGTFTLTNTSNNVATIAGGDANDELANLSYTDASGGLEIGSVNPAGIYASGAIEIATLSGDLEVTQPIVSTMATGDAVKLYADKDAAAGSAGDGNIKIKGSGSITVESGARALLYSGKESESTGLQSTVGGENNTRISVDATTDLATLNPSISSTGKFGLFRIANSIALTSQTITTEAIADVVYNGQTQEPNPVVKDGSTTLTKDTDYTLAYTDNTDTGTASVTITGIGGYSGTLSTSFNITKKALTISGLSAQDKAYDGTTDATLTGTASLVGVVSGEDVSLGGTPTSVFAGSNVGASIAVTTTGYTLSGDDVGNYTLTQPTGLSADITKRTITIAPTSGLTKEYGGSDPDLSYTHSGALDGETPAFSGSLGRASGEPSAAYAINLGSLSLTDNGAFKASNHQLAITSGVDFTITKAPLTATVNDDAKFVTQSDANGYNGVSYTGFKFGEDATDLDTNGLVISRSNAGRETAGVYEGVLEASGISADNYDITYVAGDYQIIAADQLYVKLSSLEVIYGVTPTYTVELAAYYSSDNSQVVDLTGSTTVSGTAVSVVDGASGTADFNIAIASPNYSTAGKLAVDSYDLQATNEVFSNANNFSNTLIVKGVLTVKRKELTVSVTSTKTKTYDGNTALPSLAFGLATPFGADQLEATGTGYYTSKDVGTTNYTVSGLTLSGDDAANYYIQGGASASISGTDGVINKATITVAPRQGQSKLFGASDPTLTYNYSGEANGETPGFTGSLTRSAGESNGTYAISVGTLALTDNSAFKQANYDLSFTTGVDFTISSKSIVGGTISMEPISDLVYSGANQEPTLVVKDNTTDLVLGTDYNVSYTSNKNVGTAVATVTGLGNYSGTFAVQFEIVKRAIEITAEDGSKNYGANDPVLSYSANPVLYSGDVFTGALSRQAGEAVGTFAIALGDLSAGANYELSLVGSPIFSILRIDSDGDGVPDDVEDIEGTDSNDPNDAKDTDGDGVPDYLDAFPNDPNEDTDTDGDGVGDNSDAFPNDPSEDTDTDGDGTGDNGDLFPNDPNEDTDSDGDGVGDNSDAFPNDPNEDTDTDGDGVGDNEDAFPNDPDEDTDTDGDGVGDNEDAFPNDAEEGSDLDGDGVGDNEDTDDDNDGIPDTEDAFPDDAEESSDNDGDGIGDNTDDDDDNDGATDDVDPNPSTPVAQPDQVEVKLNEPMQVMVLDNDDFIAGLDNELTHMGGSAQGAVSMDATTGMLSYTPLPEEAGTMVTIEYQVCYKGVCATATVTLEIEPDADGDGIGDSADPDDDNDGVEDIYDNCPGTPAGTQVDINGCALTTLGPEAFSVAATSVSCTNLEDGMLTLTANDTRYRYEVTVTGMSPRTFSSAAGYSTTIKGLAAGTYQVCFTPEELPEQQQCYTATIDRPTALEVNTQLIEDSKQLKLTLQGAATYTVEVNGLATTQTTSTATLGLKTGLNRIRIYTDQECQGVIEKEVFVSEVLEYAPNPVINKMELYIGGTDQEVTLTLSNISGGVLYKQTVSVPMSRIYTVDLSRYSQGTYILQAQGPTVSKTIKVIKR